MNAASVLLVAVLASSCAATHSGPYADDRRAAETNRDAERAIELNARAADLLDEDPVEAEVLLREALAADLYCGPAHNNLGIVHLGAGRLYEAAHEFEWARKLLPGHPDPRVNLAITLHRAGRDDDSVDALKAALEVSPGYLPALQGLARRYVEQGAVDERVPGWLRRIVAEGESPAWRNWAARELAMGTDE